MASIKERNGKYVVIYSYKDENENRKQNGKLIKRSQKQRSGNRKSNINKKWDPLLSLNVIR